MWAGSPASFHGEHYAFDDVYLEPKAWRPDGPRLWLGGQSVHPRLLRRIVRYAHGFHPLGQPSDEDLATLRAGLAEAGRDLSELELVGGMRAVFPDDDSPSPLEPALASLPAQIARGFTTFCIKPSQFVDDDRALSGLVPRGRGACRGDGRVRVEAAIVGNGVAGTACAMRLARHGIRPLLIGPGLPVDRPPLTKSALVKGEPVLLADEERLAERGVDRLDAMVDEVDLGARQLRAGGVDVEADAVVLATGLSYRITSDPRARHRARQRDAGRAASAWRPRSRAGRAGSRWSAAG